MDAIVPICGEMITSYKRQGLQICGRYSTVVLNLLHAFGYENTPTVLHKGCIRLSLWIREPRFLLQDSTIPELGPGYYHIYEVGDKPLATWSLGVVLQVSSYGNDKMFLRDLFALQKLNVMAKYPTYSSLPYNNKLSTDDSTLVVRITITFEELLLYDAVGKKGWHNTGMLAFMASARYWVERKKPIHMALPAFPCKTSNKEKAAASVPDGAEFEALTTLLTFCQRVHGIYKPGCQIWIVSDGHVFSDCIGVGDDEVTTYSERLQNMLQMVQQERPVSQGGIAFMDLAELLGISRLTDSPSAPPVTHPVRTKINPHNDVCRRLLVALYSPPKVYVQDVIKTVPEHVITALYRGFSRFMFEDLAFHPDFCDQTKSQRKKAAEEVALEMILRNQAYSRLVEIVLPMHIRLSIHAHDNAGPKFAVRLIPAQPINENAPELTKFFNVEDKLERTRGKSTHTNALA